MADNNQRKPTLGLPNQEPQHKQGPAMKLPEDAAPKPVAATKEEQQPKSIDWLPVDEAAKNGDLVYLKEDPFRDEWYWYKTRQYRKGVWQETGWWRRRFGANVPSTLQVTGYRKVSDVHG